MEKTGQTFEINPETFTLQNIFAMELHRFQDKIGEIVTCAVKELAIEKVNLIALFLLALSNIYFSHSKERRQLIAYLLSVA